MRTELPSQVLTLNIVDFLERIQPEVSNLEELLLAIRDENMRVEKYGQMHLNELLEISTYQWQLEQAEMKLKAPSLISISFLPEGTQKGDPNSTEEKVEAILMNMIIGFIRGNRSEFKQLKLTTNSVKRSI